MKKLDSISNRWLPWTDEEIAEACEATAEFLEGHWTQGDWYEEDNRGKGFYCVEGAMGAVLGLDAARLHREPALRQTLAHCPVYRAVLVTIKSESDEVWDSLAPWNDEGANTEQDVLDILHRTAKRVLGVPPDAA